MNRNHSYIIITALLLSILVGCGPKAQYKDKLAGKFKKETISIAPKMPGRILHIYVKEGDVVKAGDTLAMIDLPEVEAKMMQAQGACIAAKAQYEMARNGATRYDRQQIDAKLDAAKEQFKFAQKSFSRIKAMMADSLVPPQKYDETFEKYSAARAQLDAVTSMKNDIEHGVRPEKVEMALGDYQRAEGALAETKVAYAEKYIIAPKNMSIETITLKAGELLLPGYNLFTGYETEGSWFRITVAEKQVMNFKIGQEYTVKVVANNKLISCKLAAVKQLASYAEKSSSYANYEMGESVYELKLVPVNQGDVKDLYANITVILEDK
ncbi:MAG: biotin/lipoyl-binding protein [Bacteroidota bacterium]|nr:biotin/lipoyl-binding protein [Bacteroidota bacterium]